MEHVCVQACVHVLTQRSLVMINVYSTIMKQWQLKQKKVQIYILLTS